MVCRGLRRAVPAAVTPLHLCLLRSQIQHPSPSTEPRWLHLWIQGWMGPQQLRAYEILGLWAEKEGPEPPEAEGADWVSPHPVPTRFQLSLLYQLFPGHVCSWFGISRLGTSPKPDQACVLLPLLHHNAGMHTFNAWPLLNCSGCAR